MCEEILHPGDAASELSIEARATRLTLGPGPQGLLKAYEGMNT